jgi:hypothetical protein
MRVAVKHPLLCVRMKELFRAEVIQVAPQMMMPPSMRAHAQTALAHRPLPLDESVRWSKKVISWMGRHECMRPAEGCHF